MMNFENVDSSPLLRRPRQSYDSVPGSSYPQNCGTPSSLSNPRAITVSTRSPFSKLTNSGYDAQVSARATSSQYQRSISYSDAPAGYAPTRNPRPCSESQSTSPESMRRASGGLALDQSYHASQAPPIFLYQTQEKEVPEYQPSRNISPSISEELIRITKGRNHGSSTISQQFLNKSLKEQSKSFSSAFKSETDAQHDFSKYISASPPGETLASYPSPQGGPIDHIDGADQRRSASASTLQRVHSQANPSRTSSAAVLPNEHAIDDLSALLFKGATDLRNTNTALEEKSRAVERLKEELDAAISEKVSLSRQILLAKEKAKDGLASYAKKLNDMSNELQALNAQSKEFFAFAHQTKTSMMDVRELKETVKKTVEHLEISFSETGIYTPTQEWKSILSELQTDLASKQKVIDMFRDRLEFTQGDLAEAKHRVMELEGLLAQNSAALQSSSQQLVDTVSKLAELSSLLKDQQRENTDILTRNVELEGRLDIITNENSELKHHASRDVSVRESYATLQQEYQALLKLLADREEQIKVLQNTKDRLARTEELLKERNSKVQHLEASAETSIESAEALRKSLALVEAEVKNKSSLNQRLEKDLNSSRAQLLYESEVNAKLLNEKSAFISREHNLIEEVDKLRSDLEEYTIKLQQSETRYEMLQEQFEGQAMMLRMEKKSHGDVQERLLSVEESHTHIVEDLQRRTEAQVNELKDQAIRLERLLNEQQAELNSKEQENSTTLSALEARFARKVQEAEESLVKKSEEASLASQELDALKNETELLGQKVRDLQLDRDKYLAELSEARRPSQAHAEEVSRIKRDIDQLRKINESNAQRAASIVVRYEQGDLTVDEKRLIDRVHRACQSAHEQELVTKGNDIRQRDHMINLLEKRKLELEAQLARVLNIQASTRTKEVTEGTGKSLIDLEELRPTQLSTSPFAGKEPLGLFDGGIPPVMEECHNGAETCLSVSQCNGTTKIHQPIGVNVSPLLRPTFAKLDEKAADLSDDNSALDSFTPAKPSASKRKRTPDPDTLAVEESDMPQPPRRSRTRGRSKPRQGKPIETEASSKVRDKKLSGSSGIKHMHQDLSRIPKVKARKRK